jgi:manganese/iron transport system permease protein
MLVVAVTVAVTAAFFGVYASFFIDSAPAPTIVLLMSLAFVAAFFISRRRIALAERELDRPIREGDPAAGR